jgi:hypothetical protein
LKHSRREICSNGSEKKWKNKNYKSNKFSWFDCVVLVVPANNRFSKLIKKMKKKRIKNRFIRSIRKRKREKNEKKEKKTQSSKLRYLLSNIHNRDLSWNEWNSGKNNIYLRKINASNTTTISNISCNELIEI